MNALQIYKQIKDEQKKVLRISEGVVQVFESYYGSCYYPPKYDSVSKLYTIMLYGYGEELWQFLKHLNYSYAAELQSVFAIMDKLARNNMSVADAIDWTCFYSIHSLKEIGEKYVLDTKEGTVITTPLTKYQGNQKVCEFANRNYYYGNCHDATERFIKEYPEYQAVTALIPYQFGRKHYHSYVKKDEKIFDFSHNVCMDEHIYNRIMQPILLNEVYEVELGREEEKLESDDIGKDKSLLLRLAVANQKRMYDRI